MGLLLFLAGATGAPAEVVVDEVVAVVGRTPLLESDLRLAQLVGLGGTDATTDVADDRNRLLWARIRLELEYRDLEATGVVYRLRPDVDRALQALVAAAGGEDLLRAELTELGADWVDVEDLALRLAAVEAYVEQRLRPRLSVDLGQMEAVYREVVVAEARRRGVSAPPLVEVRDQVRALVVERQLNREISAWLEQARTRHEVTVFSP